MTVNGREVMQSVAELNPGTLFAPVTGCSTIADETIDLSEVIVIKPKTLRLFLRPKNE